jgi:hypothetical protein
MHRKSTDTDEMVQQVQMAFDSWLSGAEIDSTRMLELGLTLALASRDNSKLQRYCGIAWELAERSAHPRR